MQHFHQVTALVAFVPMLRIYNFYALILCRHVVEILETSMDYRQLTQTVSSSARLNPLVSTVLPRMRLLHFFHYYCYYYLNLETPQKEAKNE